MKCRILLSSVLVFVLHLTNTAAAADKLRVASSFRGLWDTTLVEFGRDKGFFKSEGIDLDLVWLQGGGAEVLQTVIARGVDIGIGIGTVGALSAIMKGAPVEIVGSEFTGASDIFFYSRSGSSIASFKDLSGKRLGIAHRGSTTETVAFLIATDQKLKIELLTTGSPVATITLVMTGQVDAGWSAFPLGMDKVAAGELRMIAVGNDAPGIGNQVMRVSVGNSEFLQQNKDLVRRFYRAYGKMLNWAYSTDEAISKYAGINKLSLAIARAAVEKGAPREAVATDRVGSVDIVVAEGVRNKVLSRQPTKDELAGFFKLVPELHK